MKICNCSRCCRFRATTMEKLGIGNRKRPGYPELWWGFGIGTIMDLSWNNPYQHKGRERE